MRPLATVYRSCTCWPTFTVYEGTLILLLKKASAIIFNPRLTETAGNIRGKLPISTPTTDMVHFFAMLRSAR